VLADPVPMLDQIWFSQEFFKTDCFADPHTKNCPDFTKFWYFSISSQVSIAKINLLYFDPAYRHPSKPGEVTVLTNWLLAVGSSSGHKSRCEDHGLASSISCRFILSLIPQGL
jgi:hypothetical protein